MARGDAKTMRKQPPKLKKECGVEGSWSRLALETPSGSHQDRLWGYEPITRITGYGGPYITDYDGLWTIAHITDGLWGHNLYYGL